jgi:predicted PurR-regulated permease PerM
MDNSVEIKRLQEKNQSTYIGAAGVQLLGGIGGVIYAHQNNYKFWGKVGFFFLGTIVTGIVAGMVIRPILIKRNAKIEILKNEQK